MNTKCRILQTDTFIYKLRQELFMLHALQKVSTRQFCIFQSAMKETQKTQKTQVMHQTQEHTHVPRCSCFLEEKEYEQGAEFCEKRCEQGALFCEKKGTKKELCFVKKVRTRSRVCQVRFQFDTAAALMSTKSEGGGNLVDFKLFLSLLLPRGGLLFKIWTKLRFLSLSEIKTQPQLLVYIKYLPPHMSKFH